MGWLLEFLNIWRVKMKHPKLGKSTGSEREGERWGKQTSHQTVCSGIIVCFLGMVLPTNGFECFQIWKMSILWAVNCQYLGYLNNLLLEHLLLEQAKGSNNLLSWHWLMFLTSFQYFSMTFDYDPFSGSMWLCEDIGKRHPMTSNDPILRQSQIWQISGAALRGEHHLDARGRSSPRRGFGAALWICGTLGTRDELRLHHGEPWLNLRFTAWLDFPGFLRLLTFKYT